MLSCAEYGPPRAMASLRGERSNALFHKATETLAKIQNDPLSLDFFQKLRKKGKDMIEAEMAQAADEEVLYRVL